MPYQHNDILVLVIPPFDKFGNLPVGIHSASWTEIVKRYGVNRWRKTLLEGLRDASRQLAQVGSPALYLDGSFATKKELPGDFDACWDLPAAVDLEALDPVFSDLKHPRAAQKARFGGELFPAQFQAASGRTYLQFFQRDRDGRRKGIVGLDLRKLKTP